MIYIEGISTNGLFNDGFNPYKVNDYANGEVNDEVNKVFVFSAQAAG